MNGVEKHGLVGVVANWGAKLDCFTVPSKTPEIKNKSKGECSFFQRLSSVWIDGMINIQQQLFPSALMVSPISETGLSHIQGIDRCVIAL